MRASEHRLRFAVVTVCLVGLLTAVTLHRSIPRYEGRTARSWFLEALEKDKPLRSISVIGELPEDLGSLTVYARAFRGMGHRGIRLVVNEYLPETPFYLEWYDKITQSLGRAVYLPERNQPTRTKELNTARRLLLCIGHPAAPELILKTRSRTAEIRGRAANLLGELGPGNEQTKVRLLEMLRDPSVEVVYRSLEVLWMTRPESSTAIPLILPFLTHANDRVRVEASYAIGAIAPLPELTGEPLQAALSDADGIVRANAARALGLAGVRSKSVAAALPAQLDDTNKVARFRAAEALARLYGREAPSQSVHLILVAAEAEASSDRYYALIGRNARMLMGDVETVREPIIEKCRELMGSTRSTYIRLEAIESLRLLRKARQNEPDPETRSLLIMAQKDWNGTIRQAATDMLRDGQANATLDPTGQPGKRVFPSP